MMTSNTYPDLNGPAQLPGLAARLTAAGSGKKPKPKKKRKK